MSRRLAAYAVCIQDERVLITRFKGGHWTLPGGGVEPGEDPFDAVTREVSEETGYEAVVERLLGVDSRVVPEAERLGPGVGDHQNVGVFYQVRIVGGALRGELNGDTTEPAWIPVAEVPGRPRSSLVDIGLALARELPVTGHVDAVRVGGLLKH
ncbi:NUDIX hydrolase [Actinoplanes derwentensis]|uniref:ADP-ribose pyrophosphatase YjhB, NUDIX family n=1 Tax=Actinoplanes derwentensis TaxID=113562 RepID=A0A1H1Z1F1_9ACTN|nr:NUDIX hydrolase [Actinoplanes derwentensis]GID81383.1 NUDIX hydrolase [Actinoplanes derwentensis]SDT27488.1 ADP-ribose pyrophosphatase YjhB, NUDIX family [Actinoplanes derwentensis]